jgi:hypothetical protein
VAGNPHACQEFYWGKRLACVVVELGNATPELVEELLTEAWARKAPKKLAQERAYTEAGHEWEGSGEEEASSQTLGDGLDA